MICLSDQLLSRARIGDVVDLSLRSCRLVSPVAFALVLLLSSAARSATVAFGSYLNESYATAGAAEVEARLDIETRLVPAVINDERYLRVLGPEGLSEQEARELLARARAGGYAGAWYVAEPVMAAESAPTTAPPPTSSPPERPTGEETVAAEAATDEPSVVAVAPAVGAAIAQQGTPVLALPPPSTTEATTQATTRAMAVAEAISVPRFEEDAFDFQLDGMLDEPIWASLPAWDGMQIVDPDVLTPGRYRTLTRLLYTSKGLYVGIQSEQPPESLIARLSARDENVNRDSTYLYLDTSGHGIYGMFFGVSLGGTLTDGTLLPERQMSRLWDGPWDGRTATTPDGYTTELFLPWSMMSMPNTSGARQLGFAVERRVASLDETWSFPALPTTRPQFLSGFQPIELQDVNSGQQLAIFPYVSTTVDQIYDETEVRAGADLFWRPSSNLQLTATLNPDFGTVELDDLVVNLTAFETFFPEKRLFFLEGNEIFVTSPRAESRGSRGSAGARTLPNQFFLPPSTLVNTRRIGGAPIAPDIPPAVTVPDTELSQPTELIGAFKTTGSVGRVQYGLMAASEDDTSFRAEDEDGEPVDISQDGRNFGVARILYEHSAVGRKAIGWMSTISDHPDRQAITHGMDLHYRSPRSRVIWDAQLLASDIDGEQGYGGYVDLNYIPRRGIMHRFSFDYLDDTLDINDLGFLRRNEALTARYSLSHTTSQLKRFRNMVTWATVSHEENSTTGRMVRSNLFLNNTLTFKNSSALNSVLMYRPEQWDDRLTEGNGDFRTAEGGIAEFTYGTDTSKVLSAAVGVNAMSEALGDWTYAARGGITFKPSDRFSLDFDLWYRKTDSWVIHIDGPLVGAYDADHLQPSLSMDVFFSAKQQLRFSMQWVGIQAAAEQLYRAPPEGGDLIPVGGPEEAAAADFTVSRLAAQLRYRWEIAPLSDLFLVYTRGANLPNRGYDSMENLFWDALNDPIVDRFIVKLRYRFGN